MRVPQLRIAQRLATGFTFVIAVFGISVGVTMVLDHRISSEVDLVTEVRVPTALDGMALSQQVTLAVADLRGYLLTGNDELRKRWETSWKEAEQTRDEIDHHSVNWTSQKNRDIWSQVKPTLEALHGAQQRVVSQYQANDKDGALKTLAAEGMPRVVAIADALLGQIGPDGKRGGGLIANQRGLMQTDIRSVNDNLDQLTLILWIMLALGVTIGVVAATMTARSIIRPLGGITNTMQTLARGNYGAEVPSTTRVDEIGVVARAVQVFKDGLIERQRMQEQQRESEKKRMEEQAELQREAEERAARMAHITQIFDKSVTEVLQTVASATTELEASAHSMASNAEETSRRSTTVAAASEQATTNVQAVASATEELSSSINEINRQVAKSSQIAQQAVEQAQRTNVSVKGLAEAASKVGEVVNLINDIAAQTNLLALNATIEAARAGDAGKGFAVVATEVKTLANNTAKATEEIAAQIASIQGATDGAVQAIEEIGATIDEISHISATVASAVEEQGAATQEIARNVEQAASGTKDVSSNIGSVSQAAGEVGSAATQVLGAAGSMAKQAETLKAQVEGFLRDVRAA